MTRVLPDFERRVLDALAAESPALRPLDDLITDGCAAALHLETEVRLAERHRQAVLPFVGRDDGAAREALALAEGMNEVNQDLDRVRELLSELMHLRSRLRLRAFLAESQAQREADPAA